MMKEEFEERIGLVITVEEYEGIEAAYAGMPGSVDKDKFVKIWLKEGGIQDLFDKRLANVRRLMKLVEEAKADCNRAWGDVSFERNRNLALEQEVKALKERLAAIVAAATGVAAA
jgi:hypothetical protein